jgi:HEAT repeat protein
MKLLDGLPALPLEQRADVLEQLVRNPSPGIRKRALRIGVAVLGDETLVEYLRRDADAALRNAGIEILKARGGKSFALAVELLSDDDPEVVLQAALILDHIKDPRAIEPLRGVLSHDDPNVAQAAIVAIGHLGDARAIPDLLPFLSADPWLQIAAVQALGDLRSPEAVGALAELLTNLMMGPAAAEAMAQIGGDEAFEALARQWLRFHQELDPETALGLLAHVLEGLPRPPAPVEGLRSSLAERLRDPYQAVRLCAARCLLALGEGRDDSEALSNLAGGQVRTGILPSCLARRSDLVDLLLEKPGVARSWGFLLAARFPEATTAARLSEALAATEPSEPLAPMLVALEAIRSGDLARPLLDLYLRRSSEDRSALVPVLRLHESGLSSALTEHPGLTTRDRVVLTASLERVAETIRDEILALDDESRVEVIAQLGERADVLRLLPWEEWWTSRPDRYVDAAAQVAVSANLRELLPLLREQLGASPRAATVRAVGELEDAASVPLLLGILESEEARLRPVAVESLGRIGGPEARRALRALTTSADAKLARVAYNSLAACATGEDDELYRDAIAHPDWFVRLAAAEVLGRFLRPENLAALSQLAADPVSIVAQKATSSLEG